MNEERERTIKEAVYTQLCQLRGEVVDVIFKSLDLNYGLIPYEAINQWTSETKRVIQIEILTFKLIDDEKKQEK